MINLFFRKKEEIANCLYMSAFGLYIFVRTWETTMFPQNAVIQKAVLLLCLLLVGMKAVSFDRLAKKRVVLACVIMLIGLISYFHGGSIHFLVVMAFVLSADHIDFSKVLKLYMIIVGAVFAAALISSQIGLIEDLLYDVHEWERESIFGVVLPAAHALGGIYTTDTAARIFFWLLVFYYVYYEKTGVLYSLAMILFSVIVFFITHGKLDSICILILALISLVDHLLKKENLSMPGKVWKTLLEKAALLSMPAAALISCISSYCFLAEDTTWSEINNLFTGRLGIGKNAIDTYGINLFGHQLEMYGFGKASVDEFYAQGIEYNYIDSSFLQILLMNGLLVLLIIIAVYVVIAFRNRMDTALMICICMAALNCIVAQHLMDISYVPFILALNMCNPRVRNAGGGGAPCVSDEHGDSEATPMKRTNDAVIR